MNPKRYVVDLAGRYRRVERKMLTQNDGVAVRVNLQREVRVQAVASAISQGIAPSAG